MDVAARDEALIRDANEALGQSRLQALSSLEPRPDLPLIYVAGAPRSGTTLAAQIMARHLAAARPGHAALSIGVINNLIARFWTCPALGIALSRALLDHDSPQLDLQSQHGRTAGPAGTHEFGYFWRRWLRLDEVATHRLSDAELAAVDVDGLRLALQRDVLAAFDRPVLWRNVVCGLNARFLAHVHPRSLFVEIRRDPLHVAASILKCRAESAQRKLPTETTEHSALGARRVPPGAGRYDQWWSLKPRAFEHLQFEADPAVQVVGQVTASRLEMDQELSAPGVHRLTIDYDAFCRDPDQSLALVCEAVGRLGVELHSTGPKVGPLNPSPCPTLADGWLDRLRAALEVHDGAVKAST